MGLRGPKPGTTTKVGGRVKGTPNKATQNVIAKLEALGCDPIVGMAEIAALARKEGDLNLAGSMYKELAQYVAPKRKAIEVSGHNAEPLVITWKK